MCFASGSAVQAIYIGVALCCYVHIPGHAVMHEKKRNKDKTRVGHDA